MLKSDGLVGALVYYDGADFLDLMLPSIWLTKH